MSDIRPYREGTDYEIRYHNIKGLGVNHIHFNTFPDADCRQRMKNAGMRWNPTLSVWVAGDSLSYNAVVALLANNLQQLGDIQHEESSGMGDDAAARQFDDEMAFGDTIDFFDP